MWKQTRKFAVTAATEVLDPDERSGGSLLVPVWILGIACLKQQVFLASKMLQMIKISGLYWLV